LGCDPLVGPVWPSGIPGWEVVGRTNLNDDPGIILYSEIYDYSLSHIYLSGKSDWYQKLTYRQRVHDAVPFTYNNIVYVPYTTKTREKLIERIDANTGKQLSNVTINVHSTDGWMDYVIPKQQCDNILYSQYGSVPFSCLVANDASTGEWIWQTPDYGFQSLVISENCKFVTILWGHFDNENMSLIRLDAKTGEIIWKTILNMNPLIALQWVWFITESDIANRITVTRYYGYKSYNLQLFSADTGEKTFEIAENKAFDVYYYSTVTFSRDGSLAIFNPLQTIAIKISGTIDAQLWSTGGKEGVGIAVYFSNSGKSVIINLSNFGNGLHKFNAQNTNNGSLIWESSWSEGGIIGYQPEPQEFLENGSQLFVFTPHALYLVDLVKSPLLETPLKNTSFW